MEVERELEGEGLRVLVVVSRFNEMETGQLLEGALAALEEHGVAEEKITVVRVPGAFEIPGTVAVALSTGGYDGVVTLGCVIRGETPHFDYVAGEAARGVRELASAHRVPIAFGVLTTDTREQALARAGGPKGHKGREAALTMLEMVHTYRKLKARAPAD